MHSRKFSPNRYKVFREEEIVASSVNNKNDLCYRMPPLGKDTIETDAKN